MNVHDRIKELDWRLYTSADRLRHYRARFDKRSADIQMGVIDRQLSERFALMQERDRDLDDPPSDKTMIGKK